MNEQMTLRPEECVLTAHNTGDGWCLAVEDRKENVVAYLRWPKAWPETIDKSSLEKFGFEIR
jgi:hypothetical protein